LAMRIRKVWGVGEAADIGLKAIPCTPAIRQREAVGAAAWP
jgi:hypothetical protein